MRTTVRIDDALLREIKAKADAERVSMTRLFNRILRAGLSAEQREKQPTRRHREKTYSLGAPGVDLTKALSLSGRLEDDEVVRKARLRK